MSTIRCRRCSQPVALTATLFPPNSRYHGVDDGRWHGADGATVAYLRRRFVPPPERFALLQEHTVARGRAARPHRRALPRRPGAVLALCDANGAMRPDELTETDRPAAAHHAARGHPGSAPMLKGIHLTLMIGPAVPVPVPRDVLDALTVGRR